MEIRYYADTVILSLGYLPRGGQQARRDEVAGADTGRVVCARTRCHHRAAEVATADRTIQEPHTDHRDDRDSH